MVANKIIHQGKKYKTGDELWKTQVVSSGEDNGNFSDVLPVMLSVSKDYIGKNIGKVIIKKGGQDRSKENLDYAIIGSNRIASFVRYATHSRF